ncbi:hypothetical protein [Vallitalea longa]|nr:hypothetical protein [Vallitalea longa]
MYLFVNLFNEKTVERKKYYLSENFLKPTIASFNEYCELDTSKIKGCIGYFMTKEYSNDGVFLMQVNNIVATEKEFSFEFEIQETMIQTNKQIISNLYRVAALNDWLDEKGYSPNAYILDKQTFNLVRKGQINKTKQSSYTSQIQELKGRYDWKGIIDLFSPIQSIKEGHELWKNVNDLYEIGFACSKLGEPKNGKTRDREHLKEVAEFRNHSIRLYKRCIELEPLDFRYLSALAYRYYLNAIELSKQKGRNDGNKDEEIENAISYFQKATALNSKSIKDNYRMGKLILEYKIKQMKYKSHVWDREFFEEFQIVEQKGIEAITKAIKSYGSLDIERRKNYNKEYIKSCYCLGSYYLQKPQIPVIESLMSKISATEYLTSVNKDDIQDVANARHFLEETFITESGYDISEDLSIEELLKQQNRWTISPMDVLYKLAVVYLYMYFIKDNYTTDNVSALRYKENALRLMDITHQIGSQGRKKRIVNRNTWFISDKYALLHILNGNYTDAIKLIKNARDGYIINTLCLAYLLEGKEDVYSRCIDKLNEAVSNKYNLAKPVAYALMLYIYKKQGDNVKYNELLSTLDKSSHKYFKCLGVS